MKILNGISGLLQSKKGVMSLLVLGVTAYVAVTGHMDASVAGCLAVVQGIFCWTAHKTDCEAIRAGIK